MALVKGLGIMASPRMQPSGTVNMTTHQRMDGKLTCYGFGQDERAINEGDLVIVGTNWFQENQSMIETEFALRIRGRDMAYFLAHAQLAADLYADNKDWLSVASSTPGLDMRSRSDIRKSDNVRAVKAYHQRSSKIV